MFLITRNISSLVTDGPNFNFIAYDYGPFDRAVYDEVEQLQQKELAEIQPSGMGRWNTYAASNAGMARGENLLAQMSNEHREYVRSVSRWVRSQNFSSLVRSIYKAYPEMRENSVFQG
jgi:hypothetical protein